MDKDLLMIENLKMHARSKYRMYFLTEYRKAVREKIDNPVLFLKTKALYVAQKLNMKNGFPPNAIIFEIQIMQDMVSFVIEMVNKTNQIRR